MAFFPFSFIKVGLNEVSNIAPVVIIFCGLPCNKFNKNNSKAIDVTFLREHSIFHIYWIYIIHVRRNEFIRPKFMTCNQ
ncbi:Os10g0174624 [Oryza sativa Japonica Group]|uniref:Os10g0174624 protein n=1 Tax=Oryza sativa subsp. japonica TaxID=39947 RepID=A0A0N7KRI1_ORYSJ|nr:Os10g0174624 [Oryza sativa Japonica Group]